MLCFILFGVNFIYFLWANKQTYRPMIKDYHRQWVRCWPFKRDYAHSWRFAGHVVLKIPQTIVHSIVLVRKAESSWKSWMGLKLLSRRTMAKRASQNQWNIKLLNLQQYLVLGHLGKSKRHQTLQTITYPIQSSLTSNFECVSIFLYRSFDISLSVFNFFKFL